MSLPDQTRSSPVGSRPGAARSRGGRAARLPALIAVCRRRRGLIFSAAALGTVLAGVVGQQAPPQFKATAAVMVASGPSDIADPGSPLADRSTDPGTVATQIALIKSRDHAARVARDLDLDTDPEFAQADPRGHDLTVTIADPWHRLVPWLPGAWLVDRGLAKEQADSSKADPDGDLDHAVDVFATRLAVTRIGGSHVVNISFTSADPAKAASLANRTAELYVEDRLAARGPGGGTAPVPLQAAIDPARGGPERAAQSRVSSDLAHDDGPVLNEQERAALQRELMVAEGELAGRRARLDLINSLRARGESLHALPEVMVSPHVAALWRQETQLRKVEAELRKVYGDNDPQVRTVLADQADLTDQLEAAIGRIVDNLENEARMIEGRIAALLERLELAEEASGGAAVGSVAPERLAHGDRLALQRPEGVREQAEIREPEARIITRAAPPPAPSSPGVPILAAFGFVGSSLVGVLVALLADRLDRRVRDGGQLQAQLGLRCLAICPRVPRSFARRNKAAHDYLLARPRSHYAESMRSLQLALRGAPDADLPKVIQITSAIPDEGKTTLALSLAASLAQTGARVLLFELDLRRPSIIRRSWSHADGPAASTPLFSELRHDPHTGVDLILVGHPPRRPEAVLTSQDLGDVVRQLRRRYDLVVVDSAPVLGSGDGRLLSELVDAVIVAIRWQSTSLDLVRDAVVELRRGSAPLLGAVITQVNLARQARLAGDAGYHRKCRGYYID